MFFPTVTPALSLAVLLPLGVSSVGLPSDEGPAVGQSAEVADAEAPVTEAPVAGAVETLLPPLVSIDELRTRPSFWLGSEFRTTVQFDELRGNDRLLLTRFSHGRYLAFSAWSDEQELWDRDQYGDPAPRLFVPRGSAAEVRLRAARRYERFEVSGKVSEVLFGEPWLEIQQLRRVDGAWNEGALVHATRADLLMRSGRWFLAADQFSRALAGLLPEKSRQQLRALADLCLAQHARSEELRRTGGGSFGLVR